MKKGRFTGLVLSLLTLFLLCRGTAIAQLPDQKNVLRNLQVDDVVIGFLDEDAKRGGLDSKQLQIDIEVRLRKAGIRISSPSVKDEPAYPRLFLRSDIFKSSAGVYVYGLTLELQTVADLDWDKRHQGVEPNLRLAFVASWQAGYIGAVSLQLLTEEIRARVADATDNFINDYLAVNAKR